MKKALLITLVATSFVLTACSSSNKGSAQTKDNTYNIQITYDENKLEQSVKSVVTTGETNDAFVSDFTLEDNDITTLDDNCRCYSFEGAYYIQTSDLMYRFQLNNEGLIESYIKFNLNG